MPVGIKNDQSLYEILEKRLKDTRIADSDLFDWQKLKCYKIFLHPRLIFPFRTKEIKINSIEESKEVGVEYNNLSSKIRNQIRKILKLPSYSEKCYLLFKCC